jgi:hypothetical protein
MSVFVYSAEELAAIAKAAEPFIPKPRILLAAISRANVEAFNAQYPRRAGQYRPVTPEEILDAQLTGMARSAFDGPIVSLEMLGHNCVSSLREHLSLAESKAFDLLRAALLRASLPKVSLSRQPDNDASDKLRCQDGERNTH